MGLGYPICCRPPIGRKPQRVWTDWSSTGPRKALPDDRLRRNPPFTLDKDATVIARWRMSPASPASLR
jgi:hypothetical protein